MEEFDSDFFSHQLFQGRLGWAGAPMEAATRAPQTCRQQRAHRPRKLLRHLRGHPVWGDGAHQANQTSNQTFSGSLVPWPRLARFANFPFHFPFRGEKGSAPLKDGLEQFQRPSKQHLRHRLHFNGGPLGIFGQSQRKRREEIAPKSLKYENP